MKQIKHYSKLFRIFIAFILVFTFCKTEVFAQSAGVNYTGAKPHSSALLDINSQNGPGKGLLIPRIALTSAVDETAVAGPAISLMIYNTATAGTSPDNVIPGYYYWNGTKWTSLGSGGSSDGLKNNLGISGGTILIGGTGVSDALRLRSTSGNGTTGSDIIFEGGDHGTTESMRIKTRLSQAVSATGGAITFSGGYTIHTFTSNGTFTPATGMTVDYLVVGGGGGGGGSINVAWGSGGGGAGGMRTGSISITPQAYSITVGSGGAGGASGGNSPGINGENSVFSSVTAIGGGGGGSYNAQNYGSSGGSGGGGTQAGTGGAGTSGQGTSGGNSLSTGGGGGGGGAGAPGQNSQGGNNGGSGGNGSISSISGSSMTYAGGGGGGGYQGNGGLGGAGGGGKGDNPGENGIVNTGGGGGGASCYGNQKGGNGGSGIVIIRYLTSPLPEGIVGIGTSTPTEKLDVAGNVKLSGALMPNNNAGTSGQILTSNGAYAAPTWATPTTFNGWGLTGNSGTTAGTNFLGTTDNIGLAFKTNNAERARFLGTGELIIGNTAGGGLVHIESSSVNKELLVLRNTNTTASASVPFFLASSSGGSLTNVSIENNGAGGFMFRTGATNEMGFGSNRMNITPSGDVQFGGFTSPFSSEMVLVRKDQNALTLLRVHNNTSGNAAKAMIGVSTSSGACFIQQNSASFTTAGMEVANATSIYSSAPAGLNLGTYSNSQLSLWTNNTERARFLSTGELVVGGTSLVNTEILSVQKNQNAFTQIGTSNNSTGANAAAGVYSQNNAGNIALCAITGTNNTYGGVYPQGGAVLVTDGTGGLNIAASNANGVLRFFAGGATERARFLNTGELIIGNTTGGGLMHVESSTVNKELLVLRNTNTTANASVPLFLASNSGSLTNVSIENLWAGEMVFRTGATTEAGFGNERMRIAAGGNVGIGCNAPSEALFVTGNIKATGTILGSQAACSDVRWKKDFTRLAGSLDKLVQLSGYNYRWRTDEFPDQKFSDKLEIGMKAQEVEKLFPEIVFTDKQGYKYLDYSRLTPILVEALKEQQAIINKLVNENTDVKNRMEKIEAMIGVSQNDIQGKK